jgi:ubiquinone/menaquinone biosynthesis C-methylase UbiE
MRHLHATGTQTTGGLATEGRLIHWARWYDPFVTVFTLGQNHALRRRTAGLAGIKPGDRVLDVGCGTGDLTLAGAALAGSGGEVVGIDASPEMIATARQKAARRGSAARFDVALIERIPFPDGSFDVALSSLMLHHLPGQLRHDGLAEVYRVLKPGGRLLVVDMQDDAHSMAGMAHTAIMALGHTHGRQQFHSLSRLMTEAGFVVEVEGSLAGGVLAYARGMKGGPDHA